MSNGRSADSKSTLAVEAYLDESAKETSLENLQELRFTFAQNGERIVSFVGAGVSTVLGVKDWSTLMSALVSHASSTLKIKYSSLINPNLESPISPNEYPEIAEDMFADLGAGRYGQIISEHVAHNIVTSSETLNALVQAIRNHMTTNFERCIENAYERVRRISQNSGGNFSRRPIVKYYSHAMELPNRSSDDWLCYLHADLETEPPIYILRKSDYETVYKHAGGTCPVNDCLKYFYLNYHIIFIGFSFDDPYVRGCIRGIAEEQYRDDTAFNKHYRAYGRKHESREAKHFLLIDTGSGNRLWHNKKNSKEYFEYWKEIGVRPILYKGGQYVFLQHLLDEFSLPPA